jgi:hypothetical protein
MSSDDALLLLQRIVQLEDIIAQYRHTAESMRCRLTELESLVGKASTQADARQNCHLPTTLIEVGGNGR